MRAEALLWPLLVASVCALGCGRTRLDEPAAGAGLNAQPRCESLALVGPPVEVASATSGLGLRGLDLVSLSDDGVRVALFGMEPADVGELDEWDPHTLMAGVIEPFGAWPIPVAMNVLPLETQVYQYRVARQLEERVVLTYAREDTGSTWAAYNMPIKLNELGPTAFVDSDRPQFVSPTAGRFLMGFGRNVLTLRVLHESSSDWAFEPARLSVCSTHRMRAGVAATDSGWLVAASEIQNDSCPQPAPYDRMLLKAVDALGDSHVLWEWPLYGSLDTVRTVPAEGGAWVMWSRGQALTAVRVTTAGETQVGPLQLTDDVPGSFSAVPWYDGVALAWVDSWGVQVATFDASGKPVEFRVFPLPEEASSYVREAPALLTSADRRSLLVGYALQQDEPEPVLTTWLARFDCR